MAVIVTDWQELVDCLDSDKKDWRDYPHAFNPTQSLRGDIAVAFFKASPDHVSDCALPIYDHQLEWIAMMFDSRTASKVNELTCNAIWHYISEPACLWLVEQEERSIAWG